MEGRKVKTYVIDASVVVKWYSSLKEDDVLKADKLLQGHVEGSYAFTAPALLSYEVANALRFNPNFDDKDVKSAMEGFFELDIALEPAREHMNSAIELAFEHTITIYDAVYAALSHHTGLPLITADYKFCSRVKSLPFIVPLRDLEI
jgi:predicted nucleic acid-binding protein